MNNETFSLAIIFAFAVVGFVYIGWTHKTNSASIFHTMNRQAGILRIISSLFTVVGASEFVVFTTLAYIFGWKSIYFFLGTLLGFITLSILAKLIRERATELDHHSIPDFAGTNNLSIPSIWLSVLSVLFTCCLVLIQILIGTLIIQEITNANAFLISGILLMAVVLYLFWGGYKALLNTDIIQGVVLFILTVSIALYLINLSTNVIDALSFSGTNVSITEIILLFFGGYFAIFGGPEIWQRIVTSKTDSSAKWGLIYSGIVMFVWGAILVLGAAIIRINYSQYDPDNAFFQFLTAGLPGWLLGVVLLAILAAIMSTADTELFAAAVISQKELFRKVTNFSLTIKSTRYTLFFLAIFVFLLSMLTKNILSIYFGLVYITFITGPIALALILKRGGKNVKIRNIVFTSSLFLASTVLLVLILNGQLISWYPLLILIPSSIPLLFKSHDVAIPSRLN